MLRAASVTLLALMLGGPALGHGDVAPQPVDTTGLPDLPDDDWLLENPYREDAEVFAKAIQIGASGYNQNCARCHGLEAISGGLAPDLRFLEASDYGDEWYVERFRHGYTQNGVTKMPAFGELLGQEAAWAIRSYIEARPDEGSVEEHADRLAHLRDALQTLADGLNNGAVEKDVARESAMTIHAELATIADQIETASGSPVADSAASRAAQALTAGADGVQAAAETLTIGLSAAR